MKTVIIYCPKHAGIKSTNKRWNEIAAVLQRYEIEYDLVRSENAQNVEQLVGKLVHDGYENIIICGGDSALNDAVNCLMKEEKVVRERVTLGVIPNGLMNDFASFWGFTDKNLDYVVSSLKQRRVRKVDAGCISYLNTEGKKCKRFFLNCVDVGLVADIQRLRKTIRHIFWSRRFSFFASLLVILFKRSDWKMEYSINYEKESHRVITMCVGSALGFGQTPNAVPYSGLVDVTVILQSQLGRLTYGAGLFLLGKILNYKNIRPYRCHDVTISCPKKTPCCVDGHELSGVDASVEPARIYVEKESINFIIEKL